MTIVFISNYFNHHQKELCDDLFQKTNGNFWFIETSVMREERKALGYSLEKPEYVVAFFEDKEKEDFCRNVIESADAVIIGSASGKLIKERSRKGKLVLRYSERPLKKGIEIFKYPARFIKWRLSGICKKNTYMLCASAYTAGDYKKFGLFKNKTYKWGYFPETERYDDIDKLLSSKDHTEILWCGRFIDWKRTEDCIETARMLKEEYYDFHMNIIGCGEREKLLRETVIKNDLQEYVSFLGSMKPKEVREHMKKAGIYLFTSNRQEGWGAVLNESMNSGCAVVASHEIGSVPFLIKNRENGFVYESGNVNMLYEKVKYLLNNPDEQKKLGKAAYKTITEKWNAEIAAERLINLSEHILSGEKHPYLYEDGPCSKAEIIDERWFKG